MESKPETPFEILQARRNFNNDLIVGDEGRDDLPKDLVSKLDKVQKCLSRFKSLPENANDKLIAEVQSMNLRKYTGEVAESISKTEFNFIKDSNSTASQTEIEAKLAIIIDLCEIMHHRYDDFQKQLVKSLSKQFKATLEVEDYEIRTNRRQTLLTLMTELFIVGIVLEYKRVFASLQEIFNESKKVDPKLFAFNVILIGNYVQKYKDSILNLSSQDAQETEMSPNLLNQEQWEVLNKALIGFYESFVLKFYNNQHDTYIELKQKYEEDMKKIERGDQDEYYQQKAFFNDLIPKVELLANLLNQKVPDYKEVKQEEVVQQEEVKQVEIKTPKYWPFDDEEEYNFYKNIPPWVGEVQEEFEFSSVYDDEGEGDIESPFDKFQRLLFKVGTLSQIDSKTKEFIAKFNTKPYRK